MRQCLHEENAESVHTGKQRRPHPNDWFVVRNVYSFYWAFGIAILFCFVLVVLVSFNCKEGLLISWITYIFS